VFVAISIPLAIIVVFMTQILHIQTEALPGLSPPKVSSCFDKNTRLKMNDGTFKTIEMIEVGDKLENNNLVTAKLKLNGNKVKMYNINGVIVSETHVVKYQDNWISVKDYPYKISIQNYCEPYIYCLNTTSKDIVINNTIFADWDELYDDSLLKILNTPITITDSAYNSDIDDKIMIKENIHTFLDDGFKRNTLIWRDDSFIPIENIRIGDRIGEDNDIVYGIVHVLNNKQSIDINNIKKNNKFSKNQNNISDSIHSTDLELVEESTLFHFLTYSHKFTMNGKVFEDYNSLIDLKIQK